MDKYDEYVQKYLGNKLKIKKIKDPLKPKKPKTAYMYFCDELRPEVSKDKSLKLGEIMKILGKKWNNLSDEKKKKYIELNKNDRIRYEEENDEYLNS